MRARDRVRRQPQTSQHSSRSGVHILRDQGVLSALITSADLEPDDLVVEIGAGSGVVTARLAECGARVVAVERSPRFVAKLEKRFTQTEQVTIVQGDARLVPLPRRPFSVVSNLPYSISTAVLRRLLGPHETALRHADLLVEWGFAKRITACAPRDFETAWWQTRFEITIARKVSPRSFNPPPSVNSAHLVIRRRAFTQTHERRYWEQLRATYGLSSSAARRLVRPR